MHVIGQGEVCMRLVRGEYACDVSGGSMHVIGQRGVCM